MPSAWKPSPTLEAVLAKRPPAANLSQAAEAAAREAYRELVDFISKPGMIEELDTDALEPIINGAFGGSNMPDIQRTGLYMGRDIWLVLSQQYLVEDVEVSCKELSAGSLALLVGYGQYLQQNLPSNATLNAAQARLQHLTQSALDDCGTLEAYLGYNPSERLSSYPQTVGQIANATQIDKIYGMVLQAVDTLGLANFNLPDGTLEFTADFWRFLSKYPFINADKYVQGAFDAGFEQNSYIMTHAAYIPTGYQRYAIHIEDSEWLFQYLRENFYASMELGSLDLLAEFVDVFRQYGCTEENDAQTRDGTQWMLELYEKAGRRWTNFREPDELPGDEIDNYNLMHKAWTAYVGLHRRVLEDAAPGTYGAAASHVMQLARRQPGEGQS